MRLGDVLTWNSVARLPLPHGGKPTGNMPAPPSPASDGHPFDYLKMVGLRKMHCLCLICLGLVCIVRRGSATLNELGIAFPFNEIESFPPP